MEVDFTKRDKMDMLAIMELLSHVEVSGQVTYAEIGRVIGRRVDSSTSSLRSARGRLQADRGIIFGVIKNTGLYRMTEREKLHHADGHIDKNRRVSFRGMSVLAATDYNSLSHEDRRQHNLVGSMLQALHHACTAPSRKAVAARCISNCASPLPVGVCFEALSGDGLEKEQG